MKNNGSQADVNISVLTKITLKMNFKPFMNYFVVPYQQIQEENCG
jgi:hypothetical protein